MRYPHKPAFVYYDTVISYAELKRQAEELAGYLQRECGGGRGERVGVYMQNCPQFIIAFYAVLRADAMVVPINPMNLAGELKYMLEDSGAKALIVAQDLLGNVDRCSPTPRCCPG